MKKSILIVVLVLVGLKLLFNNSGRPVPRMIEATKADNSVAARANPSHVATPVVNTVTARDATPSRPRSSPIKPSTSV